MQSAGSARPGVREQGAGPPYMFAVRPRPRDRAGITVDAAISRRQGELGIIKAQLAAAQQALSRRFRLVLMYQVVHLGDPSSTPRIERRLGSSDCEPDRRTKRGLAAVCACPKRYTGSKRPESHSKQFATLDGA